MRRNNAATSENRRRRRRRFSAGIEGIRRPPSVIKSFGLKRKRDAALLLRPPPTLPLIRVACRAALSRAELCRARARRARVRLDYSRAQSPISHRATTVSPYLPSPRPSPLLVGRETRCEKEGGGCGRVAGARVRTLGKLFSSSALSRAQGRAAGVTGLDERRRERGRERERRVCVRGGSFRSKRTEEDARARGVNALARREREGESTARRTGEARETKRERERCNKQRQRRQAGREALSLIVKERRATIDPRRHPPCPPKRRGR